MPPIDMGTFYSCCCFLSFFFSFFSFLAGDLYFVCSHVLSSTLMGHASTSLSFFIYSDLDRVGIFFGFVVVVVVVCLCFVVVLFVCFARVGFLSPFLSLCFVTQFSPLFFMGIWGEGTMQVLFLLFQLAGLFPVASFLCVHSLSVACL